MHQLPPRPALRAIASASEMDPANTHVQPPAMTEEPGEMEEDIVDTAHLSYPGAAAMIANDAILNGGIEGEVQKFLEHGGTATQAVEVLADSYEGVPDMIAALVDWTELFREQNDILVHAIEVVLKENEQTIVANLDREMAKLSKPPEFLQQLNSQPRWRKVINDLGRRNKSSALFNWLARTSRLEDAGVDQGIMASPQPFLNAISTEVETLFNKGNLEEKDIETFYKNLRNMCTYDENGTAVAIRLFANLSQMTKDPFARGIYRRASQEIRSEAVKVMQSVSGVPQATAVQFIERLAIVIECVAAKAPVKKDILDAIIGLLQHERIAGRRHDSDVNVLNQTFKGLLGESFSDRGDQMSDGADNSLTIPQFSDEEAHKREVLVGMLCHAEIFNAMVLALFTKAKRAYVPNTNEVDVSRRKCLCLLLSYAGTNLALEPGKFALMLQDVEALQGLRRKTEELRMRLEKVMGVVEVLIPGCPRFKFKGKPVAILLEQIDDPVVATGLLAWAREGLRGGADQRTLLVTTPKHLAFIEGVAQTHVALRKEALDILHEGFMRRYESLDVLDAEKLRDMYIMSMVSMVPLFMASQVVRMFQNHYAGNFTVDLTHLRRFMKGLLSLVEPPYSPTFARLVLNLVNHPRMEEATLGETETSNLIITFRNDCRRMGIDRLESPTAVMNES